MLMISMICFMVACGCMAVAVCFVNDNKLAYLLNNFGVALLVCTGLITATYKNNFTGYTLLLTAACAPLSLSVFRSKMFEDDEKKQTWAKLIKYLGFLLSSVAIYVAMLYIGKETYLGAILGVAVALFLTFLDVIIKKTYKKGQKNRFFSIILLNFVKFLSVGIILGACVCALLYSTQIQNIMFVLGGLVFCGHIILNNFIENKFTNLPLYASMLLFLSSILFM